MPIGIRAFNFRVERIKTFFLRLDDNKFTLFYASFSVRTVRGQTTVNDEAIGSLQWSQNFSYVQFFSVLGIGRKDYINNCQLTSGIRFFNHTFQTTVMKIQLEIQSFLKTLILFYRSFNRSAYRT